MADLVQPRESEQLQRLEQLDAERALIEQTDRQPSGSGQSRQKQRIEPDGEAREQPAQRSGASAAFPEYAPEYRRRELRDRGKRNQADRNQRVGFAGQLEVKVAEQQNEHDGATPYAEQQSGEITALVQAQPAKPQQHRHHEVVAYHRGERDRLDDHHAGGGRQAAYEHEQRKQLALLGHRQREHEGVGVDAAVRKPQQAAECDRQHEDVDRKHINRKQPDRLIEVLLVEVLDHRDLKLARQEHDGHHGENREPDPVRIAAGDAFKRSQHRAEFRLGRRASEQVAEAIVDAEGHEHAYGEKREQLH